MPLTLGEVARVSVTERVCLPPRGRWHGRAVTEGACVCGGLQHCKHFHTHSPPAAPPRLRSPPRQPPPGGSRIQLQIVGREQAPALRHMMIGSRTLVFRGCMILSCFGQFVNRPDGQKQRGAVKRGNGRLFRKNKRGCLSAPSGFHANRFLRISEHLFGIEEIVRILGGFLGIVGTPARYRRHRPRSPKIIPWGHRGSRSPRELYGRCR